MYHDNEWSMFRLAMYKVVIGPPCGRQKLNKDDRRIDLDCPKGDISDRLRLAVLSRSGQANFDQKIRPIQPLKYGRSTRL